MTVMARHQLRNGDQMYHFDGERLAHVSSEMIMNGRKPRWTEIEIWKTTDGGYMVSKIGKSRVVHSTEHCSVLRNKTDQLDTVDLSKGPGRYHLCERCWKHGTINKGGYVENDHASAVYAERPEGCVAACFNRDHLGLFNLSRLAEEALQDACELDPVLDKAFLDFDITELGRRSR